MTPENKLSWDVQISGWRSSIASIHIPADIETAYAKSILSQLNTLYDDIRPEFGHVLKDYHRVEGLIDRVKSMNLVGINEQIRKKASIEAAEFYRAAPDSMPINLFLILDDLDYKKQDLDSLLDMIDRKHSLCITMSGLLKMEASLVGR
jgi:hypothetical protein